MAKKANMGGDFHAADIADVQTRLGEIWKQQDRIIRDLSKVLEAA
jgi:hypothetical protein